MSDLKVRQIRKWKEPREMFNKITILYTGEKVCFIKYENDDESIVGKKELEDFTEEYTEPETWYVVTTHEKQLRPYTHQTMYLSKEDFFKSTNTNESNYEWVELKLFERGEK